MHLAKHPGQKVSALTLSIAAREGESNEAPGAYRAKITALVRDKPETWSNLDGARCVDQTGTLSCFTDGFFLGRFSIERAGKNRKIALRNAGDHLVLVPGVDLGAFTVLSPQNPEHALFLAQSGGGEGLRALVLRPVRNGVADDAHRHGDQGHVENERDDAVDQHDVADRLRRHRDVGDLRRHADAESEIDEVPIVGLVVAREAQAAAGSAMLGIELMRVVQHEDRVDEHPR